MVIWGWQRSVCTSCVSSSAVQSLAEPHAHPPPDSLKRERRKRRELKKKARVRSAQYAAGADGGEDAGGAPDDERMFSLGDLPGG